MDIRDQMFEFVSKISTEFQIGHALVHIECMRAAKQLNIQWKNREVLFTDEEIQKITDVVHLKYKK